jgi:hypothetical protein
MRIDLDLAEEVRQAVREEIATTLQPPRLYSVKSAAAYLDMSEEALRGLLKRGQIECLRSATGRITFTREQLHRHAAGDVA